MRQTLSNVPVTLNSWKEIASYLDRGVRTVQRWERELGLPVHRLGSGPRSPVYATTTELHFWMATSEAVRDKGTPLPALPPVDQTRRPIENSRRLLTSFHKLARTLAENTVRQRKQTEALQARILQMRKQMK